MQFWRSFYLVLFAHVAELKAPRMSPNSAEDVKVFKQVCSRPHLYALSHGAHTWGGEKNTSMCKISKSKYATNQFSKLHFALPYRFLPVKWSR